MAIDGNCPLGILMPLFMKIHHLLLNVLFGSVHFFGESIIPQVSSRAC